MDQVETAAAPAVSEGNAAPAVSTPVTTEAPRSFEERASHDMAAVFDRLNPHEKVSRSETGQFESKAPTEDTTETQGQTQTEQVQSEPVQPAIAHPQSMPAELRDKWGTVPPEVAEWVGKREAESHKRITELGETAKASEQIRSVVDRYKDTFRGVPVEQGLDKLLAANAFLEQNPVDGIKWLAQAYGVNLSGLGQQANGEQPQESDVVRSLRSELAELKRQVSDTSTRVASREQQEAKAREDALLKTAEDFAKDKQDHWKDLEPEVIAQLAAINVSEPNLQPNQKLEKAYQRALRINEAVSNRLNESKRKAEAEKAEAEKKRKADEAKKLGSLNVKTANASTPKKGDWQSTMREVADRLMG